ncbi:MAG: hypothetical protein ABIH69_04020 [bacterium]|nr:hypothetical protein [Candidatus Margulisiibacteriota bacterium]
MKTIVAICLIFFLLAATGLAATEEAVVVEKGPNFWQEFDVIFFQTLPFAGLWGHFLERQISGYVAPGVAANWNTIAAFAIIVSARNAFMHASKVIEKSGLTK